MPALSAIAADGLDLVLGGKHRAVDQPGQVGAAREQRFEAVEVGFDLGHRIVPAGRVRTANPRSVRRHRRLARLDLATDRLFSRLTGRRLLARA